MNLEETQFLVLVLTVSILWMAEASRPHREEFVTGGKRRWQHAARNISLGVLNGLLGVTLLGLLLAAVFRMSIEREWGFLRKVEWPFWVECVLALLLFDLWMYAWHRANHWIPFLWRFHRVHHSDPRMDVTTALRFHPGEIILSTIARLIVLPLIGMELWHLALYEAVSTPIILFHHSNLDLPRNIDDRLRLLVVTPWMHWVHHSNLVPETNSNYASLFSAWDRIFGSYQIREDAERIVFGLDEFPDEKEFQDARGLLTTPFR